MTRLAFYHALSASLPVQRTFYNCLYRLAAADKLPAGVATPNGKGWAFDLPNPAYQPEAAQVIIDLVKLAERPKGNQK